eukprot:303326_1
MASTSLNEQLANAVLVADDLWAQNSKFKREKSVKLLRKIYKNIKENPNENKFRTLNMSKIASKPNIVPQVRQILLCSGFENTKDGIHIELHDSNLSLCIAVADMVEDRIHDEAVELEKAREKIRQQTKQKQQAYVNKGKAKREMIKKQIDTNKKNKACEFKPKQKSKASKLKFGSKNVKVDFKTSGGG